MFVPPLPEHLYVDSGTVWAEPSRGNQTRAGDHGFSDESHLCFPRWCGPNGKHIFLSDSCLQYITPLVTSVWSFPCF